MLGTRIRDSWHEVEGVGFGEIFSQNLQDETSNGLPSHVSKARLPVTVGGGLLNLCLWMFLSVTLGQTNIALEYHQFSHEIPSTWCIFPRAMLVCQRVNSEF